MVDRQPINDTNDYCPALSKQQMIDFSPIHPVLINKLLNWEYQINLSVYNPEASL